MVLADETAEALLAQQQAARQSSTRPVTMTTVPKPAASSMGTPSSEAVDAGALAPQERFRKPSPTGPWPSTVTVSMPAAIQLPPAQKRDRPAPPDPNDMIVVKDDDEPLSGSDKPKGSAKKARTYTEAEKTTIKEKCDSLHSDCRQLQYEKEFESFKVYRKTIKKLREAPNTDDHTTYIRDYVLKEQAQSYSCARNLMTARAFLKKIRAKCNDAEKIEKADKMLREKGMPRVPDESMVDGKREKCLARYMMQVLQNKAGVVIDKHHADWGRDQNIGLYDIISPMSMTKVERSGSTRFQGKSLPAKVGYGYCPMCPYAPQTTVRSTITSGCTSA